MTGIGRLLAADSRQQRAYMPWRLFDVISGGRRRRKGRGTRRGRHHCKESLEEAPRIIGNDAPVAIRFGNIERGLKSIRKGDANGILVGRADIVCDNRMAAGVDRRRDLCACGRGGRNRMLLLRIGDGGQRCGEDRKGENSCEPHPYARMLVSLMAQRTRAFQRDPHDVLLRAGPTGRSRACPALIADIQPLRVKIAMTRRDVRSARSSPTLNVSASTTTQTFRRATLATSAFAAVSVAQRTIWRSVQPRTRIARRQPGR